MSSHCEKSLPDKLCLIPFMGFNIHPAGEWQLCCSARKKHLLNLEDQLSSIWEGNIINSVRETMLANKVHPDCVGCFQLEKAGAASRRIRFNKKRLKIYGKDKCYKSVYEKKKRLLELDISFSNLCNLDCVTCNSEYSSSWIKQDYKAVSEGMNFRNIRKDRSWKINKGFIDSLIENSIKDIKMIFIKGGEPLIEPNCLYFLKKLSEFQRDDLTVYVQTNGTAMDSKVISAIGDLNIEISFSADGLKSHYDWIRGFDFYKMLENFEQLNAIKNLKHSYFNYTVSAFNFHRVSDFIKFFMDKKKRFHKLRRLSFGIAHESHLNFRVFSQDTRKKYIRQIEETVKELNVKEDFLDGYTALLQELSLDKLSESSVQKFQKWLSFCNSMRKKNLQDIDLCFGQILKESL
ncbi:MAG: twitch domain-containing radical SAM protein [Oligoflexia bacterium]|nr:twitch domain-containing radical SAM protein [Oligoflexia bacterium]